MPYTYTLVPIPLYLYPYLYIFTPISLHLSLSLHLTSIPLYLYPCTYTYTFIPISLWLYPYDYSLTHIPLYLYSYDYTLTNGINLVKRKTPNAKNVERRNIESSINAASVHPFISTAWIICSSIYILHLCMNSVCWGYIKSIFDIFSFNIFYYRHFFFLSKLYIPYSYIYTLMTIPLHIYPCTYTLRHIHTVKIVTDNAL